MILSEEEKRRKYNDIINQLKVINSKINDLNRDISNLNDTTKRSILIDEEPYNSEKMDSAKSSLVDISNIINENIIPSLINKSRM